MNAPKNPRGEITYNFLKLILFGLENSGAAETDSKIGSTAKDNKIDTRINKFIFAGSLKFTTLYLDFKHK